MKKHEIYKDALNYWYVYCPKKDERIRLGKEPKFCPICGDKLK